VPTWAGVAYVCFITGVFSRMIVGWRVAGHMRTTMVLDAIEMARWSRGMTLPHWRCHSDAGFAVHFPPLRRTPRREWRGPLDMTVGDSYDNALAETVNGYYQAELIYRPARRGPRRRSGTSDWPPSGGCTGTTPPACTATSTTYRPPSSKPRSTLRNGPTNPWSNPNRPGLHQTQGGSLRIS